MKLAFSRPTAHDDEQRQLFNLFRPAGFVGLQLKGGQYGWYLPDPLHFQRDWGDDPGAVSALITGGTLDEAGIAALRRLIAFAHAIGSERIVFCHSILRTAVTSTDLQQFARILSDLGREACAQCVRLSLHHHYNQPVMRRADFDTFFAAADPDTVGLTVDTAHLAMSGVADIPGLIRDFHAVIDNVHLKDYAEGKFRVLGEGAIPFGPIFEALREIDYDGWLCADEESGGDLRRGMEASFQFLQSGLAAVG